MANDCVTASVAGCTLQRLGAGPHGIETVKKHAWFGKVDWAKVMDGALLFPPVRRCMRTAVTRRADADRRESNGHRNFVGLVVNICCLGHIKQSVRAQAVSPAIDDVFNEASKTEQPHYENFTKEDLYFKDF
jgi:hypothetical protein